MAGTKKGMIQANELRIGNCVFYKPIERYIEIDGNNIYMMSIDMLKVEPILITEKLLLKCGFEKHEDRSLNLYNGNFEMYKEVDECLVLIIEGQRLPLSHIKSIHQLQNLYYYLTGQELTINF